MSADEVERWVYLRHREPWGPYRLDYLCGLIRQEIRATCATKEFPVPDLLKLIPRWDKVVPKTQQEIEDEADAEWERSSGHFMEVVAG